MRGIGTRVVRKIRSHGIIETVRSTWKEIYLIKFLTYSPRIRGYLCRKVDSEEVNREAHKVKQLPRKEDLEIEIPDKIWVNGNLSLEDLQTYSIPEPSLYVYQDCHYFVPPGLGTTENRQVIPDTVASELAWERNRNQTFMSRLIYDHGFRTARQFFNNDQPINEYDFDRVLPLYPFWINYYHWTAECLPKLLWLSNEHILEPENVTITLPAEPPSWMTQSLEILGFDEYTEVEKGVITAKEMIVPSGSEPSPEECRWFRDRALDGIDVSNNRDNRIYVSREKANRRRVVNRDEVMAVLSEFGFESYVLEDLTVLEQAKLFANAEIVVGPHGAGLTNLMYSRDTAVIELFGPQKKTTYYRLSKSLGFEYRSITGKKVSPDIYVDPEEIRETLERSKKY